MEGEKLRNKKTAGMDRGISLFNLQLQNPNRKDIPTCHPGSLVD